MIDYEILLLFDAELPERTAERDRHAHAGARRARRRNLGAPRRLGTRRLAYEIDHKAEGVYHLLDIPVRPGTLDEIARVLKITDGVLRHMAVKRPKPGPTPSGPPPRRPRAGVRRAVADPAPDPVGPGEPTEGEE